MWARCLLAFGIVASANAQAGTLFEITSQNFQQASKQPVAWLLQLESPWSPTGQRITTALRPIMQQAAQYYNSMYTSKGVRVGRVNLQNAPDLRQAFCSGGSECPAIVLMQNGRAQVSAVTCPMSSWRRASSILARSAAAGVPRQRHAAGRHELC